MRALAAYKAAAATAMELARREVAPPPEPPVPSQDLGDKPTLTGLVKRIVEIKAPGDVFGPAAHTGLSGRAGGCPVTARRCHNRPISANGCPISANGRPKPTSGRRNDANRRPISTNGCPISTAGPTVATPGRPRAAAARPIPASGRPIAAGGRRSEAAGVHQSRRWAPGRVASLSRQHELVYDRATK